MTTEPTPKSTTTTRRKAASTSSAPTGESPARDPVVELGELIVAELGDARPSTLVRWLAHYTARLIHAADTAREAGAAEADARAADARDAILRLWQARTAWPVGWPPPRAAEMVRLLDELPPLDDESGFWYRPSVLGRLQDIHLRVVGTLVDLAGGDETSAEATWLDRFGENLTAEEARVLRRVASRPRRMDALGAWWGRSAEDEAGTPDLGDSSHPLLSLADAYRQTVVDLLASAPRSDVDDADANGVDDTSGEGG